VEERAALRRLLEEGGVDPACLEPLAHYGELLLETNKHFNLTGATTAAELAPHLLDSLTLVPYVHPPLLDVGSGGGLPAIPIAIATGFPVTLVESVTKKAAFLEAAIGTLRLSGQVIPQRAELAGRDPDLRERFGSATARAVSSAPTVLELVVPFLKIGGMAVLQRGKMDERERNAVADAAPMLGAEVAQEISTEGDRRILILRKVTGTPSRFPRRPGVPEKRPLCFVSEAKGDVPRGTLR
jgi:16S rRNA (guanine527-N7)-methyltransferase